MKELTINLNANEAQGEAYWRKRCDVVETELSRLRAEVKRLKEAISPAYVETLPDGTALIMTKAVKTEILRLRAANAELVDVLCEFRDNYDCDEDAHRYGTRCRCCVATDILSRAAQAKPETETCVWTDRGATCTKRDTTYCPGCGKRVEVKR